MIYKAFPVVVTITADLSGIDEDFEISVVIAAGTKTGINRDIMAAFCQSNRFALFYGSVKDIAVGAPILSWHSAARMKRWHLANPNRSEKAWLMIEHPLVQNQGG